MTSDADNPVVLASLPTEIIASLLVARLRSEGIPAETSGALTSAFRAEAPGGVQILVRPQDAPRAREIYDGWQKDGSKRST